MTGSWAITPGVEGAAGFVSSPTNGLSEKAEQSYPVNEIGGLPAAGVNINDKHIEVIARQMMRG